MNFLSIQRQSSVNTDSQMTPKLTGICIVALPREYRTCTEVKNLIENTLNIGQVASVHLAETMSKTNVVYHTANVIMTTITNTKIMSDFEEFEGRASIDVPEGLSMSWDNGKPMGHLSIRDIPDISRFDFCSPSTKMEFPGGACPSLHIPIIPKKLSRYSPLTSTVYSQPREGFYDTESGLTDLIQNKLGFGQVKRIDFVTRDDKEDKPKAAFIHFDHWYDNKNSRFLLAKIEETGNFRQKGFYNGFNMQKFYAQNENGQSQEAFIVFKINHKPIPEVNETECELNIHQLVAVNKRLLESETALKEQVAALTARIAELESQQPQQRPSTPVFTSESQEDDIGEHLYNHIMKICPERAGKITGMLLELDVPELLELVNNPTGVMLQKRVDEAITVLIESEAEEEAEARLNR